ncbi:hypothetical protein DITRI_Ditri10aG0176700 [Diplodiscus trichospermus]
MSERDDQNQPTKSLSSSFSVLLQLFSAFKIFYQNKHIFIPVLFFFNLPLSFLHFSLSFSSRPLKRHIFHLESLALLSSTRFEARQVLRESREASLSLLRLKLLYSFPSSILSLLSFIATVHATSLSPSCRPSFHSTVTALNLAWKRVVVTTLCSYAIFLLYIQLPQLFASALRNYPRLSVSILAIGSGLEVYLMGVLGLGLVVSALEEKFGWDAFRVGSDIMSGRRVCWWVVTCMLVAVSGWIGNPFEKLTDGEDWVKPWIGTVGMGWETVGLLWFYGVVVIWSYVVTTVFYCDCKNRLSKGCGTDLTEVVV